MTRHDAAQSSSGTDARDSSEGQEKKKRGLFFWATWANRVRTAWSWLFSANGAAGALSAAVVASAGVLTAADVLSPQAAVIEGRFETVAARTLADSSIVFPITGQDAQGRRAEFEVVRLNSAYTWVRGSSSEVSRDGAAVEGAAVAAELISAEIKAHLAGALAVIAAGTASQEGEVSEETARADRRARQTALWLREALGATVPLKVLNLGQYRAACADCDADTSWQRPLIIVAVRSAEAGCDLAQALADAMRGKSNVPSPETYSAFSLADAG